MKIKILYFIPFILLLNNSCDKNEKDEPEERGTIVIDFTTFQLTKENPTHTQDNITVEVTETTSEDGGAGKFSFEHALNSKIWLYPARLEIELHNISDITKVTITGNSRSRFFFYNVNEDIIESSSYDNATGDYSVSFDFDADDIKSMAVSSFEGAVKTITIE